MESTELQSIEAKAAAFQRCILSLRARGGQTASVCQAINGHWAGHWGHSGAPDFEPLLFNDQLQT